MLPYPRIFISAGERSGDRFGASLAEALLTIEPDARLVGVGGPLMASAGVRLLSDTVGHAGMGLRYVVTNAGDWLKLFRRCVRQFNGERPDILVPIDNPGFNLRLAAQAKQRHIPVCYYVSPQVWAWLPHRIRRIGRLVTRMMALFPFEKPLYDRIGVDCRYVGHPLLDYMAEARIAPEEKERILAEFGASELATVGLLPGSRLQEIRHSFPLICDAATAVRRAVPETTFLVAAGSQEHVPEIRDMLERRGLPAHVLVGRTTDVMQASRICLVVSGTAALETAYFRTPMVVVYRAGSWARYAAPRMLKVPHISLVNILAGREAVPEFLKFDDDAREVGEAAVRLLADDQEWSRRRAELDEVIHSLGPAGASQRAAESVLDCLNRSQELL